MCWLLAKLLFSTFFFIIPLLHGRIYPLDSVKYFIFNYFWSANLVNQSNFFKIMIIIFSSCLSSSSFSLANTGGVEPERGKEYGSVNGHAGGRSSSVLGMASILKLPSMIFSVGAVEIEFANVDYDRSLYGYKSYPTKIDRGFYTGKKCKTNVDHVVSLKDAHLSGAGRWTRSKRVIFANDRSNHVPTCIRVNSSKGSSTPRDFFRKSSDGKGMEYPIKPKCAYLGIYYQVKKKYRLSFKNNNPIIFAGCGLTID